MVAVTGPEIVEAFRQYVLGPIGVSLGDLWWFLVRVPRFLLVLGVFWLAGKVTILALRHSILTSRPEDPMIRSLVEGLIFFVSVVLGVGAGLMVYGVNLLNLAVTLGLIGAGLALGLRNSVANIMGGIALATDRPFEVGDRIQIGEFWGDVVEIGLRSTRVLTARREYVVIPNSLMDDREIWNYTKEFDELRLEIGCTVSYDSDVERARRIMEKAARETPGVLDFPEPKVLAREFGDSGVDLDLWCYIGNARRRYHVGSDLRERIHTGFREHGVEIPYPYRTLVEKGDLPEPQVGVPEGMGRDALRDRRILVAISGARPARRKAETIAKLAADLDADIVLAHIARKASIMTEREGERAAEALEKAAAREGVRVKLVQEEGDIVEAIDRLVEEEGCGAAIIGASPTSTVMSWKRAHVSERLDRRLDVPVITVGDSLEIDDEAREAAHEALDAVATENGDDGGDA